MSLSQRDEAARIHREEIEFFLEQGMSIARIAERLNIDERTVRYYIETDPKTSEG